MNPLTERRTVLKRIKYAVMAVLVALGMVVLSAPSAQANTVSGTTCNGTGSVFRWKTNFYFDSGAVYEPTCISDASGVRLIWQADGNLVIYSGAHSGGTALWASHTTGHNAVLALQTDGNIVVYDGNNLNRALWSLGAGGHATGNTYQFDIHTLYYMTEKIYTGPPNQGPIIRQVRYR
jgi:hypothetical protein